MNTPRILTLDIETRLYRDAVITPSGCVEWRGATNKGYGVMTFAGRANVYAHRVACELSNGVPADDGRTHALHSCNNRSCINGAHLYWGNNADNARDRKLAGTARGHPSPDFCIHGHAYTPENTYLDPRGWGKSCKECQRQATRRRRQRLREAV